MKYTINISFDISAENITKVNMVAEEIEDSVLCDHRFMTNLTGMYIQDVYENEDEEEE